VKGFLLDENIPRNVTAGMALPVVHARELGASVSARRSGATRPSMRS